MRISFYLLNRSDDVDVDIVDPGGAVVASIASGVTCRVAATRSAAAFMERPHVERPRGPDGIYYIRVSLIHQGRSVLISNNAGTLPVTVETVARIRE